MVRRSDGSIANKRYTTRPQEKTASNEQLEKRSGERNVDSRFQVQLQEDGGSSKCRAGWKQVYELGFKSSQ